VTAKDTSSTSPRTAAGNRSKTQSGPSQGDRSWLREPLLHFLVIGALVFALDAWVFSGRDDPNVIVLSQSADNEMRELFLGERGREPTDAEMRVMRDRWFDNELLYREGLSLGLDRGDTGIRERVIFKALNVVEANLAPPQADEATLRSWFESQRLRYDTPPRIDFLEAVIPGRPDRAEVEAFAAALNAGTADTATRGLRIFRGRPLASIRDGFGDQFSDLLSELPPERWHVVDSREGPRAILVESRSAGEPADFEQLRERVAQDWRDQRMAELRTAAVRALADKYRLEVASESSR
jgi:hypothetical protein